MRALAGASANVDYRGRLTLCCNLSGFRGGEGRADVAGNLTQEPFAAALDRVREMAASQTEHRLRVLTALAETRTPADLATGSPCLMCLDRFGKTPWRAAAPAAGVLPAAG